jgi:cytidine deaminase
MKTNEIKIVYEEFGHIDELNENDRKVLAAARESCAFAYAPYSGYQVGAAVLLANRQIVSANNQENSAYPSGLCAERVAIFYANANFPDAAIETLAVSAIKDGTRVSDVVKPCGSCRQVIAETQFRFANSIRLILDGGDSIFVLKGSESLLPLSFSGKDLK